MGIVRARDDSCNNAVHHPWVQQVRSVQVMRSENAFQHDGVELSDEPLLLSVLRRDTKLLGAEVQKHVSVAGRKAPVPGADAATGHDQ